MNVSDLQSMIYSAAGTAATSTGNVSGANSSNATVKTEGTEQSVNAFSAALSEEVDKIYDAYKDGTLTKTDDAAKAAEFKELVEALDGSVLGSMTANASEADLITLSNDLLGTGGGRDVLAKLMEGHFNSIVMSDSDDDDNENDIFDNAVDSYNETVSETQALVDGLEKVSTTLQQ